VLSSADRAQVMLGTGLARSLKAEPGAGLTMLASTTEGALNAIDVTVAGVVSTGIAEMDARLVYTDVATAQRLLATDRVSSLGVFLSSMEATEPARARLQTRLQGHESTAGRTKLPQPPRGADDALRRPGGTVEPAIEVRSWIDQASFYRSVRDLYNRIFGALGGILGVIVVFVVTNAMAMAVIERTREVGAMRALGTSPAQLVRGFAIEGSMLGGLGALLGTLGAAALSITLLIFPVQMPPPPGRSVGYPLVMDIDPLLYALTLVAMVLTATAASALVARRTVNQPIVDALGHV
jgi:putative ABC transport system permease protein